MRPSVEALEAGVLAGDRTLLARAITLIESARPDDRLDAERLTDRLISHSGRAIRVGLTGAPGVGKSTLIERLGVTLIEAGSKVAVLAIDPSSTHTKGSILGDKTRMTRLACDPRAFVRPTANSGALGGVAQTTKEATIVVEAAGYDVVLIETVGVGQSETVVADLVDVLAALMLPGAGDEIQGVKKGLLERVDVLAVAKADDPEAHAVREALTHYRRALAIQRSEAPPTLALSASTGFGVDAFWAAIEDRRATLERSGALAAKRRAQDLAWFERLVESKARAMVASEAGDAMREARRAIEAGEAAPGGAAQSVLDAFRARR